MVCPLLSYNKVGRLSSRGFPPRLPLVGVLLLKFDPLPLPAPLGVSLSLSSPVAPPPFRPSVVRGQRRTGQGTAYHWPSPLSSLCPLCVSRRLPLVSCVVSLFVSSLVYLVWCICLCRGCVV